MFVLPNKRTPSDTGWWLTSLSEADICLISSCFPLFQLGTPFTIAPPPPAHLPPTLNLSFPTGRLASDFPELPLPFFQPVKIKRISFSGYCIKELISFQIVLDFYLDYLTRLLTCWSNLVLILWFLLKISFGFLPELVPRVSPACHTKRLLLEFQISCQCMSKVHFCIRYLHP